MTEPQKRRVFSLKTNSPRLRVSASILLLVAAGLQAQAGLPVYGVRRTVDAIRIDGKLDEASWILSPRVSGMQLNDDPSRQPKFPTEAALVWDDMKLYVAFGCADADPWGRMKNRDDQLWQEEVVEVFLDPDGDGQNYAELEVSPNNVVVDLLIPNAKTLNANNVRSNIAGLETAVTRRAAGWVVEIAIPWKGLADAGVSAAPLVGSRWRAGLYRIKRPGGAAKADQLAKLGAELKTADPARKTAIEQRIKDLRADDEYSAWSVTHAERGFHDPERFGYLDFK
jgi:Carbohydrate family 9 binding domain-like